jgi:hypothetical protein
MDQTMSEYLNASVRDLVSEAAANEAHAYRRGKYWLTGLAICARVTKLRDYISKIQPRGREVSPDRPKHRRSDQQPSCAGGASKGTGGCVGAGTRERDAFS